MKQCFTILQFLLYFWSNQCRRGEHVESFFQKPKKILLAPKFWTIVLSVLKIDASILKFKGNKNCAVIENGILSIRISTSHLGKTLSWTLLVASEVKMALHMAAMVLGSPVGLVFLLVFPVFLFVEHNQFYQAWTAEHSAENTTKSTGFRLLWCFAKHSSWRSSCAVQTLQDTQTGGRVPACSWSSDRADFEHHHPISIWRISALYSKKWTDSSCFPG